MSFSQVRAVLACGWLLLAAAYAQAEEESYPRPPESQRQQDVPGSAVLCALEGTRPLLVEVQALVAPSPFGTPRRAVIGYDSNRLSMILAVLEYHSGMTMVTAAAMMAVMRKTAMMIALRMRITRQ